MNNNLQNMFDDKKTVLNRINYIGTLRGLACLAVYLNQNIFCQVVIHINNTYFFFFNQYPQPNLYRDIYHYQC